ncbi:MAG TPA: T9SS type A sorting domain-containing protein, partial [Flavobacteriales bacterium]|nr:T9SS type A sorting domain-containing protein [Flavobacteriales bacterium]HQX00293.1 T9SS type A sorting domain-containing protein [Flavobacteriales bacterium]
YNLTVTGANGCTSTASAVVDADITVPYVSASGGAITCTNQTVILNANGNGDFLWTGPNGFTSTSQFPMVSVAGTYTVTITAANGCTNSATTTVSNEANAPEFVADGGDLPCEGGFVVMTLFTDASNPTFSWSGPDGFTSTEQEPVVTAPGIYNVVVTTANGCSSTANVWVYRNDCGDKCPPMISECPADITVECSADYSPEALGGMPTFREDDGSGYYDDKGKKCPEIINTGWTDAYISYCPFVIQRTFYAVDEVGTTETCVQLITIHDEVGPVFENTPADRTISCDFDMDNFQLPAVWAFDECTKSVTETFHSQVVIPGDCANEYVRVHTWTSTDYCSNTSTFVWNVNVVDDEAPAFQCHPQDMTVYEVDIPEPPTCNVIDNCDPEVMIAYTETVEAVDDKEYIIVRHWTATDACGNWSEQDQSITVISKKGDGGQIDPKMLVTVAPNPFRDQCFITFEAKEEGKAVVLITDPQGRVVSEAFNGVVSKGQPTRVAFTPVENGSGFYLYRIQMNGKEVHGRMIYQP